MAEKTCQQPFDTQGDIATDYALIAVGVASTLIALIYLILS
jgi:hypothetical protein